VISLSDRRISLIGGAGFIGHNLALALTECGAKVQIIDGLQVNNLLSFTSTGGDIENRELYSKIIHQRLELLYDKGIQLNVQDAREYHVLSRLLVDFEPKL